MAPFYHAVSDEELPHIAPIYSIRSTAAFRKDLEVISRHFQFVDPLQFRDGILSNARSRLALLSFDDGLAECYDVIRPILIEMGIPAVFFINPDFLGDREIFYRYKVGLLLSALKGREGSSLSRDLILKLKDQGKYKGDLKRSLLSLSWQDEKLINDNFSLLNIKYWNRSIYMNDEQVNKMLEQGFYFGGHGMCHRAFSSMTTEERLNEISESVQFCTHELQQKLRLFAFPFYDFDMPASFMKKMLDEVDLTLSFGSSGPKKDIHPLLIQRMDMEKNKGGSQAFLKRKLAEQGLKKLFNRHIMIR